MSLLVLGDGAEDIDDELGLAVVNLAVAGHDVTGLDVRSAADSCRGGTGATLVSWKLRELPPDVVVAVDLQGEVALPTAPTTRLLHTNRPAALSALAALTGSQEIQSVTTEVRALLAALRAGMPQPAPRSHTRRQGPRVSVLVPVYNHAPYLDATMQSVLDQSYDDYEVIVLDDGSTDESLTVLRRYEGDPRVTVLTQSNIGHTGRLDQPFNRLVRASRGELLAWLGGDDVCLRHRLAAQVEAFEEDPDLDVCHGAADTIDATGRVGSLVWNLTCSYDELSLLRDLLGSNLVGAPSVMMRRAAFHQAGMWEEGLVCDYHFWLKSASALRFRYLPQRLVQYRLHQNSVSTSQEGYPRAEREARRVRSLIAHRRSLQDFFPELGACGDNRVWYEAALNMGNRLITVDHELALHFYDRASEYAMGPEVQHNRAVAHMLGGKTRSALALAESAAAIQPASLRLVSAVRASSLQGLYLVAPESALGPALSTARDGEAASSRRWDGTSINTARAYVALDSSRPDPARGALSAWCASTRAEQRVRWTFPSLGLGVEGTLALLGHLAGGLDLAVAADMTIECVDHLGLLPPEAERPTGVLRTKEDGDLMTDWLRSLPSARSARAA